MTVWRSGSSENLGMYSSDFVGGVDMVGAGTGLPVGVVKNGSMGQIWFGGEKGGWLITVKCCLGGIMFRLVVRRRVEDVGVSMAGLYTRD